MLGPFEKPHPAAACAVRTDLKKFAIVVIDRRQSGHFRHASSPSILSECLTQLTDMG
jgi:hypothetical protein